MYIYRAYLLVIVTSIALISCGGKQAVDGSAEVEPADGDTGDETSITGLLEVGSTESTTLDTVEVSDSAESDSNILSNAVIYFEYDSSILTEEGKAIVQSHAQYLNSTNDVSVILEGHADERGTREYNLALGEERAKSVADMLQTQSVSVDRMQTVSYGEERPVSLGSDESAWQLNRRVEILYQ